MAQEIHPSAIIHADTELGDDVYIGPNTVIGPGTKIGAGTKIHGQCRIEFTEMGEKGEVYPFASLGLAPQHMGYKGEKTKLQVGDRCVFREGVTVHRGSLFDQGITSIGNDGYLMAVSHVAHDCRIGNNFTMANNSLLAGHIHIGDGVFMSGLAAVHQKSRVGSFSMISGGSMVTLDVPPYVIAQGDRARFRGLNIVGLRRAGIPRESIRLIKETYNLIYESKQSVEEVLKHSMWNNNDKWLAPIKTFLSTLKRGMIRLPRPSEILDKEDAII